MRLRLVYGEKDMKKIQTKRAWKQIYKGPVEEFDALESLRYWANRSCEEKFREVSNLIRQAQVLKGNGGDEPRLLRSTAVLSRP